MTDDSKTSDPTPAVIPHPATATAVPETPQLTGFSAYQHIIPSRLGIISSMEARNGFIVIKKYDGTEEVRPAASASMMVVECQKMLAKMHEIELRTGKAVDEGVRKQVIELCDKTAKVAREAKHQRETIQRYDRESQQVDRLMTNLEWQKGARPERGAYTEEHLPEEANLRHYLMRFEYMDESEVATILRSPVPWNVKMRLLQWRNGQKMMEALNLSEADVRAVMATGRLPKQAQQRLAADQKRRNSPQKAPAK